MNRGREANGLLLWLLPPGARRTFVLIAGGRTSLPGDRGCTGVSDRATQLPCCASAGWRLTATGLLTLSGSVCSVAGNGGSGPDPGASALSGVCSGSADLGAGVMGAELCAASSGALPYRPVLRLEAPKLYLPERLPYTPPYTSPSPRRLLLANPGSSLLRDQTTNRMQGCRTARAVGAAATTKAMCGCLWIDRYQMDGARQSHT